jgi:hypothetical protein
MLKSIFENQWIEQSRIGICRSGRTEPMINHDVKIDIQHCGRKRAKAASSFAILSVLNNGYLVRK